MLHPGAKEERYATSVATFNDLADAYANRFADADCYHPTFDRFVDLIDGDASLLEVACGPGNVSKYLLSKKPNLSIFGVDLAPRMIELARQANPTARYEVLDGRRIATLDEQFDAVMSAFYLPYVGKDDARLHLDQVAHLLRRKGVFYLSIIQGAYEASGYQMGGTGRRVYTHYYEEAFLRQGLEDTGFDIVAWEKRQLPSPDGDGDVELFFYCLRA